MLLLCPMLHESPQAATPLSTERTVHTVGSHSEIVLHAQLVHYLVVVRLTCSGACSRVVSRCCESRTLNCVFTWFSL